jgi:hypothetical protein
MALQIETQNKVADSGLTPRGLLATIALVIDIIIVSGIALGQLAVSILFLLMQFTFIYMGGFHPVITPYMLCGIVSASFLFSCRFIPRIIAIAWQVILVGTVIAIGNPASPPDMAWKARALWIVPATLYLLASTAVRFRIRMSTGRMGKRGQPGEKGTAWGKGDSLNCAIIPCPFRTV